MNIGHENRENTTRNVINVIKNRSEDLAKVWWPDGLSRVTACFATVICRFQTVLYNNDGQVRVDNVIAITCLSLISTQFQAVGLTGFEISTESSILLPTCVYTGCPDFNSLPAGNARRYLTLVRLGLDLDKGNMIV